MQWIDATDTEAGWYRLAFGGLDQGQTISFRAEVKVQGHASDPTAEAALVVMFADAGNTPLGQYTIGTRLHGADFDWLILEGVTIPAGAKRLRFGVRNIAGNVDTITVRNLQINDGSVIGLFTKPSIPGQAGIAGYSAVLLWRPGSADPNEVPEQPDNVPFPSGWYQAPQPTKLGESNWVIVGYKDGSGALSDDGWSVPALWTPADSGGGELPETVVLSDVDESITGRYVFSDGMVFVSTADTDLLMQMTQGGKGLTINGPLSDGSVEFNTTGTAGGNTLVMNGDGSMTLTNRLKVIDGDGLERSQPVIYVQSAEPAGPGLAAGDLWIW